MLVRTNHRVKSPIFVEIIFIDIIFIDNSEKLKKPKISWLSINVTYFFLFEGTNFWKEKKGT